MMKYMNLFKNLVLVWVFILSTGITFATNELTQDAETQNPTTESANNGKITSGQVADVFVSTALLATSTSLATTGVMVLEPVFSVIGIPMMAGSFYLCTRAFSNMKYTK